MSKPGKTTNTDILCEAILSLENVDECKNFLRDLMTEQEIEAINSRLQCAILITEGIPYRQISKITNLSTTTVSRVAFWLNRGKNGYKTVIERLKKKKIISPTTLNLETNIHHKPV